MGRLKAEHIVKRQTLPRIRVALIAQERLQHDPALAAEIRLIDRPQTLTAPVLRIRPGELDGLRRVDGRPAREAIAELSEAMRADHTHGPTIWRRFQTRDCSRGSAAKRRSAGNSTTGC